MNETVSTLNIYNVSEVFDSVSTGKAVNIQSSIHSQSKTAALSNGPQNVFNAGCESKSLNYFSVKSKSEMNFY